MYTSKDLHSGQVYETAMKNKLTIQKIDEDWVHCKKEYSDTRKPSKSLPVNINIFLRDFNRGVIKFVGVDKFTVEYHAQCKPLDKAFKELDKQLCRHHNVRKDYFFSAMVYLTCKDCGKPLN